MKYTSFGIAVIESIWPNPSGSDYLGKDDPTSSDEGVIKGIGATDIVGETFHEDTAATSGWYKIVPLNMISFKTQASTSEGNKWSATFTADDMVIIQAKVDKDDPEFQGTAILSDILDSMAAANFESEKTLNANDLLSKTNLAQVPFVSRRVSLKDGLFNLQDLVLPGDTISIWFYNDPSEFFPFEEFQGKIKSTTKVEDDLYEVIGSGDRKLQFMTNDDQYASQSKLALPSQLYGHVLAAAKSETATSSEIRLQELDLMALTTVQDSTRIVELGGENIKEYVAAAESKVENVGILGSTLKNPGGLYADQLAFYLTHQYSEKFSGFAALEDNTSVDDTDKPGKSKKRFARGDYGIAYKDTEASRIHIMYYLLLLYRDAGHLQNRSDTELQDPKLKIAVNEVLEGKEKAIQDRTLERNDTRPPLLEPSARFDPNLYMAGRKLFLSMIKDKINESAKMVAGGQIDSKFLVPSVIKRKTLTNKGFGETAYLVMKGHVQGISTARSATNQTITINGSGLEFPLEKHLVFFDTVTDLLGANSYLQDYMNGSMASMNPAQQMLFLITKYAPKQVRWGPVSSNDNITRGYMKLPGENSVVSNNYPKGTETKGIVLKRGNLVIDRDPSLLQGENIEIIDKTQKRGLLPEQLYPYARLFTPLTHYSLYRLGESIRSYLAADPSGELGNTTYPHQIEDRTPVMQMIKQIAGAQNIMEFFVDSTGYMIYRVAGEAWERTPITEYTPTIDEESLVSLNFSESEDNIATLVDVTMQQMDGMGNATNSASFYHFGRGIARAGKIPIKDAPAYTRMNELPMTLSPEMFRYGLRYQGITDVYGGNTQSARDKANTIYRFYGSPIKRAEVTLIGNSSYRAGDTVYMCLPSLKKRMKKRLSVDTLEKWLRAIYESPTHTEMYVGNEGRLRNAEKFYTNPGFTAEGFLNLKYLEKSAVLSHILETVIWMKPFISQPVTWDIFPTTAWWYLANPNVEDSAEILSAYAAVIKTTADRGYRVTPGELALVKKHLTKLKFNNFVSMSFYIDSVSHAYEYNSAATTTLSLSYGQENICLFHPVAGVSVGFFSVDRKIRDKFPGTQEYFEIHDGVWRKLFVAQFKEDQKFRKSSFIYQASEVRNTSNYVHSLAEKFGKVLDDNYIQL